jgi:hypothetical protein
MQNAEIYYEFSQLSLMVPVFNSSMHLKICRLWTVIPSWSSAAGNNFFYAMVNRWCQFQFYVDHQIPDMLPIHS